MNKPPIVVVDADAIIAQTDSEDVHHQKANAISKDLIAMSAQVLYPVTAIAEAATHMQRALNSTASAYGTVQILVDPSTQVVDVDKQTLAHALSYFHPTTSKKNTVFDCIVAAVAEEYDADAIFSFDTFYTKKGFQLAEDLETV